MGRKFSFSRWFTAWARGETSARKRKSSRGGPRILWLLLSALGLVLTLCLVWNLILRHSRDHPHDLGPHGGTVVAIHEGEPHYHSEVLVDEGGVLRLYILGEGDVEVQVEPQLLSLEIVPEGSSGMTPVMLRPAPPLGNGKGTTSQFFGKLPVDLVGKHVKVVIPDLKIAGTHFRFDFRFEAGNPALAERVLQQEKDLFLKPGGKYTQADIKAAGQVTASEKFKGVKVAHDLKPKSGDAVCPVSLAKAHPEVSWVVGGKTYHFCCPPCASDFVQLAKERPEEIKGPESFKKKQD